MCDVIVKQQELTDGSTKVKVQSPYNPEFTRFARGLKGSWNKTTSAWYFDLRDEENVREACREIYGTDGTPTELVTLKVTATDDWDSPYHEPLVLAGRPVASAFGRKSGARLGDNVYHLGGAGAISAGSAKWWCARVKKGTILELRDVPVGIAEKVLSDPPSEVTVEIIRADVADRHSQLEEEAASLRARLAEIEAELEQLAK